LMPCAPRWLPSLPIG